ncbi:MAG: hypothetical protein V9E94_21125 [Microthrixaceae bacterium]
MLARLLLSSSLVLPASSPAPPARGRRRRSRARGPRARGQWLHAVWSDGDGLLAILEYGKTHLSCRTGEEAILAGVSGLQAVDGRWIDGAPVVVAVSDEGTLVRWRAGAWELLAVPRSGRDPLVAVAIDARGRVVVAGATGGIHRLDGERWQTLAYPAAMKAVALSGLADGSFVVLGAEGELARGQPGARAARAGRRARPAQGARCGVAGPPEQRYTVRTTASAQTASYKEQVRSAVADASQLRPGPVQLQIAFVVGAQRNWMNLWKPTIDSLHPLLGRTRPDREWHPNDGRIIDLSLHVHVDSSLGHDVVASIAAEPASAETLQ